MCDSDLQRVDRLIRQAVDDLELDLRGTCVLTEAASGPFVVTAPMAALAGADRVVAVTRDSKFGTSDQVFEATLRLAESLGCSERIELRAEPARNFAHECDLVTNLGFVRPIDDDFLSRLPMTAVVSLMCEPWELRNEDVDIDACRRRGIPVIGTNETHPRLETFQYVGVLALKLLLETGLEVRRCRILVVGSDPFGAEIMDVLTKLGSECRRYDPTGQWPPSPSELEDDLKQCDAIVVSEHREPVPIIGAAGIPAEILPSDLRLVHVAGIVDATAIANRGLVKHPSEAAPLGRMTVTTGYVGPQPVVDLHAGGLRAGIDALRAFKSSRSVAESEAAAEYSGYGLRIWSQSPEREEAAG